jgi:hypothetical protein
MPTVKQRPNYDEIAKYFHLPLSEASIQLGIGRTLLKQSCRYYNIGRWPYKKKKMFEIDWNNHNLPPLNQIEGFSVRPKNLPPLKDIMKLIFEFNTERSYNDVKIHK